MVSEKKPKNTKSRAVVTKTTKVTKTKVRKPKKSFYQEYIAGELKLERYQKIGIFCLIIVLTGFIGWMWEFLLAEIEVGFQHLIIKGGNLLPWMNIYAYGAIVIMIVSYKLKKYPWAVFAVSAISCGLLELFAGWIVYTVGNGTRYWDYSKSWWGVGNINGFVCPVSACVFGLGALALVYWLMPWAVKISFTMTKRAFLTLAVTLFVVVMADDVTNLTLKNLGLPTAHNLYLKWGWVYK